MHWIFKPVAPLVPVLVALGLLTGCSSLLYYPAPDYYSDPSQFRHKPEQISFASEDGTKLTGWYFKSAKRPAKGTLLFFHGNAQNISTHFYGLYWILDQGYDYFIFDYRGYGLSDGKPSPQGTVADGRAALSWIREHRDPHGRLTIFAQSLGGAIGLRVACERPQDFDQIVADSTFTSYKKVARKVLSHSWITWAFQWLPYLVLSDEYAPGECVPKISPKPILVVHGTDDNTVAYSLGEELYAEAAQPKEFWRIEGGRHTDFLFRDDFVNQKKLLEWLEH